MNSCRTIGFVSQKQGQKSYPLDQALRADRPGAESAESGTSPRDAPQTRSPLIFFVKEQHEYCAYAYLILIIMSTTKYDNRRKAVPVCSYPPIPNPRGG